MKRKLSLLVAAGSFAIASTAVMAAPPKTTSATPTSPTGNGGGYNHLNSPQHTTGQPMQSCETTGSPPGGSGTAPGSAFNQNGGTAGSNYAGEKPQNSRNTASTSQYDVACTKQPH